MNPSFRWMRLFLAATLALTVAACDDDDVDDSDIGLMADAALGGAGGSGGSGAVGGGGGEGGQGAEGGGGEGGQVIDATPWETPMGMDEVMPGEGDEAGACGATFLYSLRGWVTDEDGLPLADVRAQPCVYTSPGDVLMCLRPGVTTADGLYTKEIIEAAQCHTKIVLRAVLAGTRRATTYCAADLSELGDGVALRMRDPLVSFDTEPATTVPPEGDVTAARAVVYADGLTVQIVPERFFSMSGEGYAAASVRTLAPDTRGLCLTAGEGFETVYGFYPEANVQGEGFGFEVPNTTGLAAGAAVELFVLGGLDCTLEDGTHVPEAEWASIGGGVVSADGATIVPEAGLPCFNWLAYKVAE